MSIDVEKLLEGELEAYLAKPGRHDAEGFSRHLLPLVTASPELMQAFALRAITSILDGEVELEPARVVASSDEELMKFLETR
jgi:hypothetical protein